MQFLGPVFRSAFLALLVASPLAATSAANTTSLNLFQGRTTGTTKLETRSRDFLGKSTVRVALTSPFSAKIKITASVQVGGRPLSTNNELVFAPNGQFRGKELAPGDTTGSAFRGQYTATANVITFGGKFRVGPRREPCVGTFSGTVTKRSNGKLIVTYAVFVAGSPTPTYIYTYAGK